MKRFHGTYTLTDIDIAVAGNSAAWLGREANKYASSSAPWKAAIYKLAGIVDCMNCLGITACIRWGQNDTVDAVYIGGRVWICNEKIAILGLTAQEGGKEMLQRQKQTVEDIERIFPVGCRVKLVRMDDPQAPAVGTLGTVTGVDDMGDLLMAWDNGSSLNVIPEVDEVAKV